MRKIMALAAAALMGLSMTACWGGSGPETEFGALRDSLPELEGYEMTVEEGRIWYTAEGEKNSITVREDAAGESVLKALAAKDEAGLEKIKQTLMDQYSTEVSSSFETVAGRDVYAMNFLREGEQVTVYLLKRSSTVYILAGEGSGINDMEQLLEVL